MLRAYSDGNDQSEAATATQGTTDSPGPVVGTTEFVSTVAPLEVGGAQREIEDALLAQGVAPDEVRVRAAAHRCGPARSARNESPQLRLRSLTEQRLSCVGGFFGGCGN